jgi:dipeptidase E
MGETRDIRIKEFHAYNTIPVLDYVGSWLKVDGDQVIVKGEFSARLFKQNQIAEELETGTDISYVK